LADDEDRLIFQIDKHGKVRFHPTEGRVDGYTFKAIACRKDDDCVCTDELEMTFYPVDPCGNANLYQVGPIVDQTIIMPADGTDGHTIFPMQITTDMPEFCWANLKSWGGDFVINDEDNDLHASFEFHPDTNNESDEEPDYDIYMGELWIDHYHGDVDSEYNICG